MRKTITLGAAAVALAVLAAGCHDPEPARSPADLGGIADKTSQGLDKSGSTINSSGVTNGEKQLEQREEHPAPAETQAPAPPPPEPKP
jgi:hypothetical protein